MQMEFATIDKVVGYLYADCAMGVYLTRDEIAAIVTPLRTSQYGSIFGDEWYIMYHSANAAAWQRAEEQQLDTERYLERFEALNAETRVLAAGR